MIKYLLLIFALISCFQAHSHDVDDFLNDKMTYDYSKIFDFPANKEMTDPECQQYAHKKAIYYVNYVKHRVKGFEILLEDVDGKSVGKDHLACILTEVQTIKWKAGDNVRYFTIGFYSDTAKTQEACPSKKAKHCERLRNEFKTVHMLNGRKLGNLPVESFYYDVTIIPSNGYDCLTKPVDKRNRREDTCVLDPKLKIVR